MIQPQQSEQPICWRVFGGEIYSNLFNTPTATYLWLPILRQPISKSYSQCPSLGKWAKFSIEKIKEIFLMFLVIFIFFNLRINNWGINKTTFLFRMEDDSVCGHWLNSLFRMEQLYNISLNEWWTLSLKYSRKYLMILSIYRIKTQMTNQIEYKVEWWLFIILLVLITQQNTLVAFLVLPHFNLFLSTITTWING